MRRGPTASVARDGPHGPGASRWEGGFTLIEIMVVMVLMAVLSAMIVPEMRGTYADAVLRASSRDLANVCGLASSRAVSLQRAHRVEVDPREGRFQLSRQMGRRGREGRFVPVKDVPGCAGTLDDRVRIEIRRPDQGGAEERQRSGFEPERGEREEDGAGEHVTFYPDGTADSVELAFRHRSGLSLAMRVNPVTARLRVVEMGVP